MLLKRLALLLALTVAACGDDDDDGNNPQIDGGTIDSSGPSIDAVVPRGNVEDLDTCAADNDCANVNSDGRQVPWFGPTAKACLPRCESTTDCGFGLACYPK